MGRNRCCDWNTDSRIVMLFALILLIRFHKKLSYYIKGIWKQTYSKVQMLSSLAWGFLSTSNAV
ncbi:MAG: hypothetical protein CM15mP32_4060 [Flavobacteriaceae bacterium]|nr:MAG: hypothetical protein CM15mP32_4060 [Flavobacteriaceae bacterium]